MRPAGGRGCHGHCHTSDPFLKYRCLEKGSFKSVQSSVLFLVNRNAGNAPRKGFTEESIVFKLRSKLP